MKQAKSVFKIIAGEQRPFSQNDEGGKLTLGTFVLEHIGKFENDMLVSKRTVVPGSGTNDLTGLRGDIDFVSGGATEFPIVLNYYFE